MLSCSCCFSVRGRRSGTIPSFRTSASRFFEKNGQQFLIEKVYVGSLGDFDPAQNVQLIFPLVDDPLMDNYPACPKLTSAHPSAPETVKYSYYTDAYYQVRPISDIKVGLIPDYDRNGVIDNDDRLRASTNETFYFWINDDDDEGFEDSSKAGCMDIPGTIYTGDYYGTGRAYCWSSFGLCVSHDSSRNRSYFYKEMGVGNCHRMGHRAFGLHHWAFSILFL